MADAVIGAARVVLGFDWSAVQKGVKAARSELASFDPGKGLTQGIRNIEGAFKNAAAGAGGFGTALTAMGGAGLAAGAALGALVGAFAQTRDALKFGDEIADTANKLAVTTDTLQEYRYAIHQLGGEYKDADTALQGFTVAFGAAEAGLTKRATKPFDALQLDPKSFATMEEALQAVIAKIQALGSTAEQAAIADKLGLTPMLPAIRAGTAALDEMRKKAHDLGFVMDADLIARASEANDKFEDLAHIIDVQFKGAFIDAAPAILKITEMVASLARETGDFIALFQKLGDRPTSVLKDNQVFLQNRMAQVMADNHYRDSEGGLTKAGRSRIDGLRGQMAKTQAVLDARPATAAPAARAGTALISPLGKGLNPAHVAEASDAAVAKAAKDEIEARIALTGDIAKLAALRAAEVDQETRAANQKLQEDAAQGKITQAAAAKAAALNDSAALEKKALITRQAEEQNDDALLAQKQKIGGYYDQIAAIESSLARSAGERNAIEAKNLADRQRLDREQTENDTAHQVIAGTLTEDDRQQQLISQRELQAKQREQQAVEALAAVVQERFQREEDAVTLQASLLQSQADAAGSETERFAIEEKLLKASQELERLKLLEIAANPKASEEARAAAENELAVLTERQTNEARVKVGGLLDNYDRASSAIGGLADAIKAHDWVKIYQSLDHAIADLKTAFTTTGATLESKVGAVGGVVGGIGQAIGGTAGGAISGAAGGAVTGFSLGGPVGAVIGGLIGGIAGLFGSSKEEKAQKTAAAQQAAEQAAAHALSVSNESRQLQIQLLLAEGKAEAATALQREAAIAGVNAENAALEGQLFDLQAAADKAAQAAAVAKEGHDLQLQLMEAEGDAMGALSARRADELAALDEANRGVQLQIYNLADLASAQDAAAQATADAAGVVSDAQAKLSSARDASASALNDTISKFQGFADSLKAYRASLDASEPATATSYAAAAATFARTAAQARLGDANALGSLQGAGETFLTAAKAHATSQLDYNRDLAKVKASTEAAANTATRQVSMAQSQLDGINATVNALLKVDGSVLSVADAIKALAAAQAAQAAAGPAALAAALARFAPAEGVSIHPLPPPPIAPNPAITIGDAALVSAVNTGPQDTDALTQAFTVAVDGALGDALGAIARNTRLTQETLDQWSEAGMPAQAA